MNQVSKRVIIEIKLFAKGTFDTYIINNNIIFNDEMWALKHERSM